MPHLVTPNSFGSLREMNDCHSPKDGKFCSGPGRSGHGPLTYYPYPEDSVKIPGYLKKDVARAARAGIVTYHHQQPEPVRDTQGNIHDPLAKSHAKSGTEDFKDAKTKMRVAAPTGKIRIVTRGGEFEPTYTEWGEYGPSGIKRKELTPEMLERPASRGDVISTYRHEIGHLMDRNFSGGVSTPEVLAREIRAWTHAVEIAPGHRVSQRMVLSGLESHAYYEFRRQHHLNSDYGKTVSSWDRDEWSARMVQQEIKSKTVDPETLAKAKAFARRASGALVRYGAVLRRKKITKDPPRPKVARWNFPGATYAKAATIPGPGRGGLI